MNTGITTPATGSAGHSNNLAMLAASGGFRLTEHQKQAYGLLKRFAMGEEKASMAVLTGYAGTGKTTIVGKLVDEVGTKLSRIAVCAPTNKAVKVLREKITGDRVHFATLHSLLGLRMKESEGGQMNVSQDGASSIHEYELVIVDECSMISPELFKMILTFKRSAAVLFVGDPAQLPPVGESMESPVFSLVDLRATLSEVVRQARDNPIIELSMAVRQSMKENRVLTPTEIAEALPPAGEGVKACLTNGGYETAVHWALAEVKAGRECRIVAYTNDQVRRYNEQIHTAIYGPEAGAFVAGERVMMQEAAEAKSANSVRPALLHTSEELDILSVEPGRHPRHDELPAHKVQLKREDGSAVVGYIADDTSALQNLISNTFSEARSMRHEARYGAVEARAACDRQATELNKKAWGLKKAFLPIRHTYSITAHKSQGSTFDTVLVDYTNLCRMRSAYELNRALYVAITRPSQFLAVVAA